MLRLPFIRRLKWNEYVSLFLGILFVTFEKLLSGVVFAIHIILRPIWTNYIKRMTKRYPEKHQSPFVERARAIHDADDIRQMCNISGYNVEEHLVRTQDDYILCIHRISKDKPGKIGMPIPKKLPVVYCHHGLLMNSEVWVCNIDQRNCLVYQLVDQGYDVWLGNNRGNKYSRQHLRFDSTDVDFWNFSIDDFAHYDIPDTIDYILKTSEQKQLTYIGFSQGTAQAFAALSVQPLLNEKVNSFIALAPAMSPKGLHNRIVDAFVKARPSILFFLFGRKSILPSAGFWQSILPNVLFNRILSFCLAQLFNWSCESMSPLQRHASFAHLYSYTSVKCLVHWFQIMRSAEFRMYDNDQIVHDYFSKHYRAARFPTKNIRTPILLFWGDSDSLVDIQPMLNSLPPMAEQIRIPGYEHLDMIWADTTHKYVIPSVLERLSIIYAGTQSKENADEKAVNLHKPRKQKAHEEDLDFQEEEAEEERKVERLSIRNKKSKRKWGSNLDDEDTKKLYQSNVNSNI
ncbi:triglyceride lipase-cholesterol esterase [Schizosaccharomyces cryophilus OY26]|uniref:Triglyceride lipase-cholesterol esterase n=1 Tax=Schizosaccharomyces cryophilus (strain OY26 / ATCC MYA-4695 / CBS 11777 / NBRC 106824 / NRRL Y48691) TaxID=653667 RepID=S9VUS6_SCHCR|nr:triglyceride lipase-cholesterol esterase [Schizosaccharomyces cryophilus OY26]EPY49914.1 triglyceride lipase-cholesterol esterase [Schizosaccharomyces cryophilus OY26]